MLVGATPCRAAAERAGGARARAAHPAPQVANFRPVSVSRALALLLASVAVVLFLLPRRTSSERATTHRVDPPPPTAPPLPRPRFNWQAATLLVAVVAAVAGIVGVLIGYKAFEYQTQFNRSRLDVSGEILGIERPSRGELRLVIAVNVRNLGGMLATITHAVVRRPGIDPLESLTKAKPLPSGSPETGYGLLKERIKEMKGRGELSQIVDLSPGQTAVLETPVRVEARAVVATPRLFLRLRVELERIEDLRQLVRERREALSVDLFDEEERRLTLVVWDCTRAPCQGILFRLGR